MACIPGTHVLIEILKRGQEEEETVVRWCQNCGAIVVDVDFDGRTNPGAIMKMKLPNCSKNNS